MKRKFQRAAINAQARQLKQDPDGVWWEQRTDEADPTFAIITFRLPTGPVSMPTARYEGHAAWDRLHRFLHNFAAGVVAGSRDRGLS